MLPEEVINHMDIEELRNYIYKLSDVEDTHGDMVFARDEVIDALQRLYNNRIYMEETRIRHDVKLGSLREIERILGQKYDEFMPRPTCCLAQADN